VNRENDLRPIVKWVHCADHDPIDEWIPDDERTFSVWIQVGIGPIDGPGTDDWQFHVRSVDSSDSLVGFTGCRDAMWSGPSLVLRRWHYLQILREIDMVCRSARSTTWPEVFRHLDRYGDGPPILGSLEDARLQELEERAGPPPGPVEDLSIAEQFQRMQKGQLLGVPVIQSALERIHPQEGRHVWFWGLTDPAVQAFWLSITDELLVSEVRYNISPEVRLVLPFSDDPREQSMAEAFSTREFAAFYDEIDARVWGQTPTQLE
jgi:hypothetical protein